MSGDSGTIEVRLPEGPVCGVEAGDASCILPMANLAGWHEVYSGHLAKVALPPFPGGEDGYTGYVTWQEGEGEDPESVMLQLRPDVVDPAPEEE